jgi:hypothetical protein
MSISAKIIMRSHIEDNSKTLFSLYRDNFLLLKGEGRYLKMNKTARATEGFAVITCISSLSYSFISRKREREFA